jgi:hypothetical protein
LGVLQLQRMAFSPLSGPHAMPSACPGSNLSIPTPPCPPPSQVKRWNIADLRVGNCGTAAEAQDFLCHHAERIKRLANLQMERNERNRKRGKAKSANFAWINKRPVVLQ